MLVQGEQRLHVQLANRLLVKTLVTLSADELRGLDAQIEKVQSLAPLTSANLWLVTLRDSDVQRAIQVIAQDKRVIYAQPDVLQTPARAQDTADSQHVDDSTSMSSIANESSQAVRLAIIDDGFNFDHPEFAGLQRLFEYDADQRVEDARPKSAADHHGTLVAGVIAAAADQKGIDGLLPEVELIAIRQVSSWTSDMVLAFSVARMMGAQVVNSSWVLAFLPEPLFDVLNDWGQTQQPYLIFSAGNDNQDACTANALSQVKQAWLVGAVDAKGERMSYSNHGNCVTLYAKAYFKSTAASGRGYRAFSGTSAAAAYVSGILARELSAGRQPDVDSLRRLLQPSEHLPNP